MIPLRMRQLRKPVVSFIAAGLTALSIARTAMLVWEVLPSYYPGFEDEVSQFERTLAPVRAHLAARRQIGYLATVPNDKIMNLGYGEATWRYFLAQYTVVPVIVSRRPGITPLLADLGNADALEGFASTNGYLIVWQHGGFGLLDARSP